MSQSQQDNNWDLDSDEIASIASEELYENRPNRWKGPKSTWRHLTQEERMLWRSMKQLQNEDLGVHLYNVFALKRRAANPDTAQDMVLQTDDGQEGVWMPPKMWTAWPMREKDLPPEGLFKDEGDEDDQYTLRRKENPMPSSELRDELTATILRIAKERFSRRKPPQSVQPSIEVSPSPKIEGDGGESSSSELDTDLSTRPAADQATRVNIIDDEQPNPRSQKKADKTYDAVISSDDDLSASLLKPFVRHILAQLDKTLTILHNARVAGLSYLSESSETETEEEGDGNQSPPRKRSRVRPRLPPQPRAPASSSEGTSRRGRPKLIRTPEPGETLEQMEMRLARYYHRRLPATEEEREAAFEEWLRQGDKQMAREKRMLSSRPVSHSPSRGQGGNSTGVEDDDEEDYDNGQPARTPTERVIQRWGLRDWSDVIGAAALAGFPPQVLERATRRCADLFGQGMALTRLDEVPAARAGAGVRTTVYRPERIHLSPSDDDSDEEDEGDEEDDGGQGRGEREASLKQRRMASRQASLALSSREASAETPRKSSRTRPSRASPERMGSSPPPTDTTTNHRSSSRSRSRSRSLSSAGIRFCPVLSCERAAMGFDRRANLQRHIRLVHPGHDGDTAAAAVAAAAAASVVAVEDTDDETVGAVHVDGFLRTINPGRGWHGGVMQSKKRRWDTRPSTPSPRKRMDVEAFGESE